MIIDIWYGNMELGECNVFKKDLRNTNLYKIIICKEPGDKMGYNIKGRTSKIRIFDIGEFIGEGNIIYDEFVRSKCVGFIADKLIMYAVYSKEKDKNIFTLLSK